MPSSSFISAAVYLPLPLPPVFLLLFCSAICFAAAVPDSRVDNLGDSCFNPLYAATFSFAIPTWNTLKLCKFNALVDVQRCSYCTTARVDPQTLQRQCEDTVNTTIRSVMSIPS